MNKNKIASNLMDSISKRINVGAIPDSNRRALVLINGSNMDISSHVKFIDELRNEGYSISLGMSFMAERLLDSNKLIAALKPNKIFREEDIIQLKSIIDEYELVVGPNITMNTMVKVSTGMTDSFVPNVIWSFLYFGKKVYLDFSSVRNYMGRPPASEEIARAIEDNIKKLIKMGVKEIPGVSVNSDSTNSAVKTSISKDSSEVKAAKRIITQNDIPKMNFDKGVFIIEKNMILTPLAKDKIKSMGIKIVNG